MSADALWIIAMTVALLGGILSGLPVIVVISGVPLLFALVAGAFAQFDLVLLQAIPLRVFGIMENALLIAVPLFVLVGVLLERSRQAERMLASISRFLGGAPGALVAAVLVISTLVAASTGVIGATVIMLGMIALPALLNAGVDDKTASGLVCASGTLGQIIPPSIVLILLGDQVSNAYIEAQQAAGNFAPDPVTVGDLFAGALVPGLCLVVLYGLYAIVRVTFFGARAVPRPQPLSASVPTGSPVALADGLWRIAVDALPTLALIVAVLGSILVGIATPTEAAAVGVAGTLLIAASANDRRLRLPGLLTAGCALCLFAVTRFGLIDVAFATGALSLTPATIFVLALIVAVGIGLGMAAVSLVRGGVLVPALFETLIITGMIFGIIVAASILALIFRGFEGDRLVADFLTSIPGGVIGMLVLTMAVIFVLGFILEFVEIIFIVIPIVGPVILQTGIDPVWFAVLVALNLQTSFLTPPFGFALFYFRSVAPRHISTGRIFRAVIPFIAIQLVVLGMVAAYPPLATWLPEALF
ncbi:MULTISPECIES: TRAP transporter large permease subunit [unclassified Roseitalea]|uniref:TRAP transporter large permease n=1 Tax=unclassified Roseitalea TaxID=2639107 RepID=UPI00273E4C8C|nr:MULTISPECIES: TRAP transporter large permease subunit [unclassified Roseitalea]